VIFSDGLVDLFESVRFIAKSFGSGSVFEFDHNAPYTVMGFFVDLDHHPGLPG
jgi:hypothetical protein